MKLIAAIGLALACGSVMATDTHRKSGYFKKDGTYVAPSYATNPNDTKLDNYSTKGNVNPYTGKGGTKDPYAIKPPRASKR